MNIRLISEINSKVSRFIIRDKVAYQRTFDFAKRKKEKTMPGLERINLCGRLIEGARRDFLKYYLKKCPTLFHICYDPIGTHRKARAFIGFLFGFVAAVVLYEGIIVDLQFDMYTSISLGAILVAMLSIGCASSIQVISFRTSLDLALLLFAR